MLRGFAGQDLGVPTAPDPVTSEDFRLATEVVLLRQARTGTGVILGRRAALAIAAAAGRPNAGAQGGLPAPG